MEWPAWLSDGGIAIAVAIVVGALFLLFGKPKPSEEAKTAATGILSKLGAAASGSRVAWLGLLWTMWQERATIRAAFKSAAKAVDGVIAPKPDTPPAPPAGPQGKEGPTVE